MIFPIHKKYTIITMMVVDVQNLFRLEYYVYLQTTQKIHRWKYPQGRDGITSFDYADEIIKVLSKISGWDHIDFLNSTRTMDDENFWNNYVFKKENGNYIYLEEVEL
jgi:hypothetical protein